MTRYFRVPSDEVLDQNQVSRFYVECPGCGREAYVYGEDNLNRHRRMHKANCEQDIFIHDIRKVLK